MLKICLTGGPCAGKSSAFKILDRTLSERGYKILFCPETASELILNGIIPGDKISLLELPLPEANFLISCGGHMINFICPFFITKYLIK